jgi:hypothetical protein
VDPTLVEDQGAGRNRFEDRMIMGGDHHRRPLVIDVTEKAEKLGCEIGIQIAGWFVGQDQSRLISQGPGYGDTLLLATGEGIREGGLSMLQPETLEHLKRTPLRFTRRDAVDAQYKGDVLQDGFPLEELEILKNYANFSSQQGQTGS